MQDHSYSIEVEGTPDEVWTVFWGHRSGRREHNGVMIEVLCPGNEVGEGLVRHCTFPVPRWLLSGGRGVSWEWLSEVRPPTSWRYEAVGKPLWSRAEGWTRLEDLGNGRTRVHFRETYHAFNPVLRALFEARVHRAISKANDQTLARAVETGVRLAESVKRFETLSYDAFCAASSPAMGSLIQAMVGSFGGSGLRWWNRAGFAA